MSSWARRVQHAFYLRKGFARVEMGGFPILLSTEPNVKQVLWLRRHLRRKDFEPHVIEAILNVVHEGDAIYEIGAWIGPYSVLLSRLAGGPGRVYLFEPDPVARKLCEENLFLNQCENSTVFPFAVSDRNGQALLYNAGNFGDSVSTLIPSPAAGSNTLKSEMVVSCTLDAFVEMTSKVPDFVKVDVEGAEDKVIAGGKETLSRRKVKAIMEVHTKFLRQRGIQPSDIISSLMSLNKKIWILDGTPKEITRLDSQSFTDLARFHILAAD